MTWEAEDIFWRCCDVLLWNGMGVGMYMENMENVGWGG